MCGDCMPQFHVRVCVQPVGIGRVQNDMQALWKHSVSSLYFLYKPNQTKKTPLHLNIHVSSSKQKKHFNAEIRLPYPNWFDHLPFFAI